MAGSLVLDAQTLENETTGKETGKMNLKALSAKLNRPLVIPLMGYPGIQLTHSTIKQNEFNSGRYLNW